MITVFQRPSEEKGWKVAHTFWDDLQDTAVFRTRVVRGSGFWDFRKSVHQMLKESLNTLLYYFDMLVDDKTDGDKELMRGLYRFIWKDGWSPAVIIERARIDLRTLAKRCGDKKFIDTCQWMMKSMDELEPYFE